MPIIVRLESDASKVYLTHDPLTPGWQFRRSYTNNVDKSDVIYTFTGPSGLVEDTGCLQDWTYYYWIVSYDPATDVKTILWGPTAIRLKTVRLEGSRNKKRFFDRDVECELCGNLCKKSSLRRGYVAPHVVGENYLPNAAAPENWTSPAFSLMPNFNIYTHDYTFFPNIEKPYQFKYPGVSLMAFSIDWSTRILFPTTPTTTGPGVLLLWAKSTPLTKEGAFLRIVGSTSGTLQEIPIWIRGNSWQKYTVQNFTWVTGETFRVDLIVPLSIALSTVAFGGMQIYKTEELTALPDRQTALGQYTTGGMMPLCPECYSGLRRRAPWEQ